jgi:hypothetical protein
MAYRHGCQRQSVSGLAQAALYCGRNLIVRLIYLDRCLN